MISIKEELNLFKKKSIEDTKLPLNDLYGPFIEVEDRINNMDKINKKTFLQVSSLSGELEEKQNQIKELKRELKSKGLQEEKFVKKIAKVLDQIDYISEYGIRVKNDVLNENIALMMKVIRKELREVGFDEIPAIGEIFDAESHECVEAVTDSTKQRYEIIGVVKKGYKYNGKVIRSASVIAVK